MKRPSRPKKKLNITGDVIRRLRVAASPKISQEDMVGRVARLGLQLSQPQVALIEAGKRMLRDFEVLAFAKALKVPVQALYEVK